MTSRAHSILRLAGRPLHQKSILRQSTLFRRSPASTRGIVVLGIETSADDTCAALLRIEGKGENRVVYTLCEDRTTSSNIKRRGIDPYEAVVSHTQQSVREQILSNFRLCFLQHPAFGRPSCHQEGSNYKEVQPVVPLEIPHGIHLNSLVIVLRAD